MSKLTKIIGAAFWPLKVSWEYSEELTSQPIKNIPDALSYPARVKFGYAPLAFTIALYIYLQLEE